VLVFGTGENGQLGIGPKKRVAKSPAIIAKLSNQDIVKIRCGMTHNLAITSTGDIFSWGCGLLGRLGHGNQRNVFYPRRMALLHQFSVERYMRCDVLPYVHVASAEERGRKPF